MMGAAKAMKAWAYSPVLTMLQYRQFIAQKEVFIYSFSRCSLSSRFTGTEIHM